MSTATQQHKALVAYCEDHHCATCPVYGPEFGALDDSDYCVVSHALDKLKPLAEAEGAVV
jgi:hypothetical protein